MNQPAATAVVEPPKHHKYGPSSLKNRDICPGWKNDRDGDTTFADEGTMMHSASETGNLAGLDPEQTEQVQKVLNYVAPLERNAFVVHKEKRLTIMGGMTFGTADRVIGRWAGLQKHFDCVDFKFGRNSVDDADENRQGMAYVIGIFEEFQDAESVTVHFLIPRRDEVLKHTFFRADLPRLRMIISTIINRARYYDETYDASVLRLDERNCLYCGRRGTPKCPVSQAYMLAHAKKYAPLEIAEEVHSSQITDPHKMSQFFIAIRVLEKMVDSGKKHVMKFVREIGPIPGFEMRERKGSVKITNSLLAYPILKEILDPVELASVSEYSYSDIAKIVSERAPKGQKSKAVGELYTKLSDAECVTTGEPSEYLTRSKSDDEPAAISV